MSNEHAMSMPTHPWSTMNKKTLLLNGLITGGVLLAALVLWLVLPYTGLTDPPRNVTLPEDESAVVIMLGSDEVYQVVPLSSPETVTIRQDGGRVNVVEVTEEGVHMLSSTCPGQDCVNDGWLKVQDAWYRQDDWIVCLHNKVSVQLVVNE